MLAGTVPVYLGAKDIQSYVPPECFIDAGQFANMKELCDFLEKFTQEQAESMISAGRSFLRSDAGMRYSYEAMAERVALKLEEFFFDEAG